MSIKYSPGFHYKDLEGLISNTISVDFYFPKIEKKKNSIVICFYCKNEKSANDLFSFIQKSPIDSIIDIEVSLSPTKKGYWIVFVEFELVKNKEGEILKNKSAKNIYYLINETNGLTGNKNWYVIFYKSKKYRKLTKKILRKYISITKKNNKKTV